MMGWYIASVSWGKDSLAMLHMLIEHERPLDEVVFYDTGVEFEAIYVERDRTLPMFYFELSTPSAQKVRRSTCCTDSARCLRGGRHDVR